MPGWRPGFCTRGPVDPVRLADSGLSRVCGLGHSGAPPCAIFLFQFLVVSLVYFLVISAHASPFAYLVAAYGYAQASHTCVW